MTSHHSQFTPEYNEPIHHKPTGSLGRTSTFNDDQNEISVSWVTGSQKTEGQTSYTVEEFNQLLAADVLALNGLSIKSKKGYSGAISAFLEANQTATAQTGCVVTVPAEYAATLRALYWVDFNDKLVGDAVEQNRGVESLALYQAIHPCLSDEEFNVRLQYNEGFAFTTDARRVRDYSGELTKTELLNKYVLALKIGYLAESSFRQETQQDSSDVINAGLISSESVLTPGIIVVSEGFGASTHVRRILEQNSVSFDEKREPMGVYRYIFTDNHRTVN